MENEVKQRNQRNRRRERAQRMQAQRESKAKDGDSAEDESPAREKPQRPPNRRKKSKEPPFEEDIIDGFAILAFRTYEDLEVRQAIVCGGPICCHVFGFRIFILFADIRTLWDNRSFAYNHKTTRNISWAQVCSCVFPSEI